MAEGRGEVSPNPNLTDALNELVLQIGLGRRLACGVAYQLRQRPS